MSKPAPAARREHWDGVHSGSDSAHSSYTANPSPSLTLLDALGLPLSARVLDVGGADGRLVDALVERGHTEVTVVDLSPVAIASAQSRLGDRASEVDWVTADVTVWQPDRSVDVWHDRSVLQFLVDDGDLAAYCGALDATVVPGGYAVIATFSPDGPALSAGLPVQRYSPKDLLDLAGAAYEGVRASRQEFHTVVGVVLPFTWVVLRRR